MKGGSSQYRDIPLKMVGGNKFGRVSQISPEQTFNMIVSDDALVPFAGYRRVDEVSTEGTGRGIYASASLNKMYAVINNRIYEYDSEGDKTIVGSLETYTGDVFIDQNNADEIVFSDDLNIYVYDGRTGVFTTLTPTDLGFRPGYLTFQNGYIISPDLDSNLWYLSQLNQATIWPGTAQFVGSIATKAGKARAAKRVPSRGNLLFVFGENVGEYWQDSPTLAAAGDFPYQRNQTSNIDFGLINPATLDSNDHTTCWVAKNEKSGPAIMYSGGSIVEKISTDGIDYRLSQLEHPESCYGYMLRLNGHVFYIVTWNLDNVTYMYDFNTKLFFTLTDEKMNAFIPKRVAFFQNRYFFVSINDGNVYELGAQFSTYDYGDDNVHDIPWIRVCPTFRLSDQSRFKTGYAGFPMQQGSFNNNVGDTDNVPRIDLSVSKDNGTSFGNYYGKELLPQGKRANRLMWYGLGYSNNITPQFRFNGFQDFIFKDGVMGVSQ